MRKQIIFLVCFAAISLGGKSQGYSLDEIKDWVEEKGYTIATTQYATLKEGETAYHYRNLYSTREYIIVAFSEDKDVKDVDVFLYDDDGSELRKDADASSLAIVKFSPSYTREMKIVIKNCRSYTPSYASTCRFVVAYK